jgi:hypothetical protein
MIELFKRIVRPIAIPILRQVGIYGAKIYAAVYRFAEANDIMDDEMKKEARANILQMIQDSRGVGVVEATVILRELIGDYPD